jgi:hypothetical protein
MGYIADREEAVRTRIVAARKRVEEWRNGGAMQRTASASLFREVAELDRIHRASKALIPEYRERFVKCVACGNTFHDERSFLSHWQYGLSGAIECVGAPYLLKMLCFEIDEYRYPEERWPERVYRKPIRH